MELSGINLQELSLEQLKDLQEKVKEAKKTAVSEGSKEVNEKMNLVAKAAYDTGLDGKFTVYIENGQVKSRTFSPYKTRELKEPKEPKNKKK